MHPVISLILGLFSIAAGATHLVCAVVEDKRRGEMMMRWVKSESAA